jgi:hypothetical protein
MTSIRALLFVLASTALIGASAGACANSGPQPVLESTFDPAPDDAGVAAPDVSLPPPGSQDDSGPGFEPDSGPAPNKCLGETTCAKSGANCGPLGDGCGGVIDCGTCSAGSCGGGGTPSVCGMPPCTAVTCGKLGFTCGPAGDGCGGQLNCGACTGADLCGGGGQPGVCGHGQICTPKTCGQLGYDCGPAGDGCGGQLNCGTCISPQACGGGGTPSVCGAPVCTPKTCAGIGPKACGPIADGCGGLLHCPGCSEPETCGGQTLSTCGVPPTCTGLCLQQTSCPTVIVTTSISGKVYAPNGTDPLPNVLVYIPNAPVAAFKPGVSCDNCAADVSGSPLITTTTGPDGKFILKNAPVGANIPLVIQTGRWRRQVTVANVAKCVDNPQAASLTRLPKNKTEGDIPHMAFATGALDSLECVLRKIGVDDTEFTAASGAGRIHIYTGAGSAGANAGTSTTDESKLWGTNATLNKYDMVLFPCQGGRFDMTPAAQANMIAYANAGGRVFATHYSYVWLYDDAPFSSTANWAVDGVGPADQVGTIDTSFPKGATLAQWLVNVGASTTYGQIPVTSLRQDFNGVVAPSQAWISISSPSAVMHYTFNTPVGAAAASQCGRVLFDDFHVEESAGGLVAFPAECTAGAMTAQEKLLEFMLFDLGSCVTPDVPKCTKTTCAAQGIKCGPAADGCGGVLDCGPCPTGQTCGGGGIPSTCGAPSCSPRTCLQQNIHCGPAGDGCGKSLDCGACTLPDTCGGGGTPGVCGRGTCTATTCAAQNIHCGPAGDGCGNALDCGPCPAGQTCGGGGKPGVCGTECSPLTCAGLGFNCGIAGDGCGGQLNCGTCVLPQTCGGGGQANVCGGSSPK